jgi:hypothetical protein
MSTKDEDTLPNAYKYSWTAQSDLSLQDFLSKVTADPVLRWRTGM